MNLLFPENFTLPTFYFLECHRGVQGRWSPDSFIFYNIIYMGCVLWAMHQTENEKPAQLVNICLIIKINILKKLIKK